MKETEKTFYQSDYCRILRNIGDLYDESKYYEKEEQKKEMINKLSNIEKFKFFVDEMEKEFNRKNITNGKKYKMIYGVNYVEILCEDDSQNIKISFENTSKWTYNESDNCINYCYENKYYYIQLDNMHHKCHLRHYIGY